MEFPFGHQHNHHNRRDDDYDDGRNEERQRYPPPSFDHTPPPSSYYGQDELAPPPPPTQVTHVYHTSHGHVPPPPSSQEFSYDYSSSYPPRQDVADSFNYPSQQPPPPTHVHHSSHEQDVADSFNYPSQQPPPPTHVHHSSHEQDVAGSFNYPSQPPPPPPAYSATSTVHHVSHDETHHSHLPSFLHHQTHSTPEFSNKPTVKVFSKAQPNFSLTIRDGKVILAPSDPTDPFQHWYKDEKYSTRVKDQDGFPCFALVNKATGQAMKHSIGATHPVQLIPYNPDVLDESILWTEGKDSGHSFRTIRMINNIRLNVDAFHGDKHSGGVRDGTLIVLWEWNKGDNQQWKIIPY